MSFVHPPLPSVLQYFTQSVGVSKNRIKIQVDSRQAARPGDVLEFSLPPQLVDLRTLQFNATVTTTAPTADKYCTLMDGISLFDSVGIHSSGFTIDNCVPQHYNLIARQLDRRLQGNGALTSQLLAQELISVDQGATPANDTVDTNTKVIVRRFPGTFIGECQPRIVDFALFPAKLTFTLAPLARAFKTNDAAATAELKDIYLTCDVLQFQSDAYESSIRAKLASGGAIELPWKKWTLFQGSARPVTDAFNFSLNTTSLKALVGWFVPNSRTGVSWFSPAMPAGGSVSSSYWTVGSQQYPAFLPSVDDVIGQTADSLKHSMGANLAMLPDSASYGAWGYPHMIAFGMPDDEDTDKLRLKSGVNTYGASVMMTWQTQGANPSGNVAVDKLVVAISEPSLKVSAGGQLEVVP